MKFMNRSKRINLVGSFIRNKRESMKMSQRELGQKFESAVTTQFVSNLERGITPLPANHISSITKALQLADGELQMLMEREYVLRLNNKLQRGAAPSGVASESISDSFAHLASSGEVTAPIVVGPTALALHHEDHAEFKKIYDLYRSLDASKRSHFLQQTHSLLETVQSVNKIS